MNFKVWDFLKYFVIVRDNLKLEKHDSKSVYRPIYIHFQLF